MVLYKLSSLFVGYQSHGVTVFETTCPTSGKKFYIPVVAEGLKPKVGMIFDNLDDAHSFYSKYAKACGFAIRKSTEFNDCKGVLKLKYFVCSKEGFSRMKKIDTMVDTSKHKSLRANFSKRTGCVARIRMDFVNGKWSVYKFDEQHNHLFVDEHDMHFLPSSRQLTHLQKHYIHSMSKMNIGYVKAFNMMKTTFGGFEEVGASKVDFKNYKRDLNLFIGEYDAEMAVSNLMLKKEYLPNFSCEYFTDDDNCLKGLFWADDQAKKNYYVFGDVISFDATYRSNRFVPCLIYGVFNV